MSYTCCAWGASTTCTDLAETGACAKMSELQCSELGHAVLTVSTAWPGMRHLYARNLLDPCLPLSKPMQDSAGTKLRLGDFCISKAVCTRDCTTTMDASNKCYSGDWFSICTTTQVPMR